MVNEGIPDQMARFSLTTNLTSNSEHCFQLELPNFSTDFGFTRYLKEIEKDWIYSFSFSNGHLDDIENLFTLKLAHSTNRRTDENGFTVSINYKVKRFPWKDNEKYSSIIVNKGVRISFIERLGGTSHLIDFDPELDKHVEDFSFGETKKQELFWDRDYSGILITVTVTKRPEGSVEMLPNSMTAFPNLLDMKSVKGIFSKYLFDENLSDCKVVAGVLVFPAHRFVLKEISGYCDRMFSIDKIENEKKIWKIDDFEPAVVEEFLEFAYTGTSANLNSRKTEILKDLFRMSHKYDVVPLKIQCEYFLIPLVNDANVVSIYSLGYIYDSETLRVAAKTYFNKFKYRILPNTCALTELYKTYSPEMIFELAIK